MNLKIYDSSKIKQLLKLLCHIPKIVPK